MAVKRACGFVIFRRMINEIQFLLLQTSYGIHHWTPPKGHVDPGENDLQTAFRETQEEAGFSKDHLKVYENKTYELNYPVNGNPKTSIYWLAELINPETPVILSDEHQNYAWEPLKKSCELVNFSDMIEMLEEYSKYIATELKQ